MSESRTTNLLAGCGTLAVLAALSGIALWLASSGTVARPYDIFFAQSVQGLAVGSAVTYAGVPAGQVDAVEVWRGDPALVRVRITVPDGIPVLEGTTASLRSELTGTSTVSLAGGSAQRPPLVCSGAGARCPLGVPVIPVRPTQIASLAASTSELATRAGGLAQRMSLLGSARNRAQAAAIGQNLARLQSAFAAQAPAIEAAKAEVRVTRDKAGRAGRQMRAVVGTARAVARNDVRPMMAEAQAAISSGRAAAARARTVAAEVRPALGKLRRGVMPEVRGLAQDGRALTGTIAAVRDRARNEGAAGLLGPRPLPDYRAGAAPGQH